MVASTFVHLVLLNILTFASGRFVLPQRSSESSAFVSGVEADVAVTALPGEDSTTSNLPAGPCATFQVGDPLRQELYSPNYPHNYPNHSDCIRVLEAEPGHVLRLDFRDEFNLEPSEDCKFDYLEVRDGEHGYSSLIGKFCGHQFPPMLKSSSRYLWLRFHSDDNIEYTGFRAVYSSVPRPTANGREVEVPPCRMAKSGLEGYVNRSDIPLERVLISTQYNLSLDCMWVITVDPGWKINLLFVKFSLERPNDCESNFIDIFPERTDLPSRMHNFCGSMAEMVSSKSNILHVRFMAEPKAINSSFEIVFTAFRDRAKDETCADDEYDCEDATCISQALRCNGRANCRFSWDEDDCKVASEVNALGRLLQEEHMVIILIIFFLILTGMCSAFIYNCARKIMRDSQMIKEQIQHSFASREDSICQKLPMGTMLTPISTILPQLGDVSVISSACGSPRVRTLSTPNLRTPAAQLPCHVPSPEPLDVRKLQQHVSLDNFSRATVETYALFRCEEKPSVVEKETHTAAEVKDSESQTRESQFVFTSMDNLTPPPPPLPPPPPPRLPTVFMETDLDLNTRTTFRFQRHTLTPPLTNLGQSRSHENLSVRCTDISAHTIGRRTAPDVIAAH